MPPPTQRTQRFQIGDTVAIVRGGPAPCRGRIYEVVCDPLVPTGEMHPTGATNAGCSAKYRMVSYPHWVYDWMLEPVPPDFNRHQD